MSSLWLLESLELINKFVSLVFTNNIVVHDYSVGLIPEPPLEENIEQRRELWHSGFKWRKHNIYYDE